MKKIVQSDWVTVPMSHSFNCREENSGFQIPIHYLEIQDERVEKADPQDQRPGKSGQLVCI